MRRRVCPLPRYSSTRTAANTHVDPRGCDDGLLCAQAACHSTTSCGSCSAPRRCTAPPHTHTWSRTLNARGAAADTTCPNPLDPPGCRRSLCRWSAHSWPRTQRPARRPGLVSVFALPATRRCCHRLPFAHTRGGFCARVQAPPLGTDEAAVALSKISLALADRRLRLRQAFAKFDTAGDGTLRRGHCAQRLHGHPPDPVHSLFAYWAEGCGGGGERG